MYLEYTIEDTFKEMESMLLTSMSKFRFPRFRIYNYDRNYPALTEKEILENGEEVLQIISRGAWEDVLTHDEIDILAELMLIEWYNRQLAVTRNTQMKYSTSEFKMTSQGSHMQRLLAIITQKNKDIASQQHFYKRRKMDDKGYFVPNYDGLSSGEKTFREQYAALAALGAIKNERY